MPEHERRAPAYLAVARALADERRTGQGGEAFAQTSAPRGSPPRRGSPCSPPATPWSARQTSARLREVRPRREGPDIDPEKPARSCTSTVADIASPRPSGPNPVVCLSFNVDPVLVATQAIADVAAHLLGDGADSWGGAEDGAVEVDDFGMLPVHHRAEAREPNAARVLVRRIVLGEVVAKRADREGPARASMIASATTSPSE